MKAARKLIIERRISKYVVKRRLLLIKICVDGGNSKYIERMGINSLSGAAARTGDKRK